MTGPLIASERVERNSTPYLSCQQGKGSIGVKVNVPK